MKIISHRGNLSGPIKNRENNPTFLDLAIKSGFDIEIDLWVMGEKLFLGHDFPEYEIQFRWIRDRITKLWVHCKNLEAAEHLSNTEYDINYFWHQNDDFVLTSHGYFWTYPGKKLCSRSIAVLPEIDKYDITEAFGVCTDYPTFYSKK